jgi:hypothetical protein
LAFTLFMVWVIALFLLLLVGIGMTSLVSEEGSTNPRLELAIVWSVVGLPIALTVATMERRRRRNRRQPAENGRYLLAPDQPDR